MTEIEALQRALTVACNDVANTIGEILTILDELPDLPPPVPSAVSVGER